MKTPDKYEFLDNKAFNSLEKARKCEVVIDYGMGKDTDISIYNTIYNILTLHYIQYIISNSLHLSLNKIKYVCFSKNANFLLWLFSPHTEAFSSYFRNNFRNFEEIIAKTRENAKNTGISEKISNLVLFLKVTNNCFWLRKWRNRLRIRLATKPSYINENMRNQKIVVTEPVQLGYALFLSDKRSFFKQKAV